MSRVAPGVVIAGGSAAGLAVADSLREGGYDGTVTVLDEDLHPAFDRPMLSKGLLASPDYAEPGPLRSAEQLAGRRIDVLPGHAATGLDIDRRLVVTSWGEAVGWQHVVIATGAAARPLATTGGTPLPTLRNLADLRDARAAVADGRPVTLIGGGFIGLEVAAALRSRGVGVTLLDSGILPLVRSVGEQVATWLRDLHRSRGVELELGSAVVAVEDLDDGYEIVTANGRRRSARTVLAGVGAEPRTEWLIGSGIKLDDGVLTDAAGRTNVPGAWAAGDVARSPEPRTERHRRFGHWTHAIEQGRQVGLNIARGEPAPYEGVPYVWTEQYGLTLHLLGERRPGDTDLVIEGDLASGSFAVAHGTDGEFHAVTVSGHVRALRTYKKLLRSGASLADALSAVTPA